MTMLLKIRHVTVLCAVVGVVVTCIINGIITVIVFACLVYKSMSLTGVVLIV